MAAGNRRADVRVGHGDAQQDHAPSGLSASEPCIQTAEEAHSDANEAADLLGSHVGVHQAQAMLQFLDMLYAANETLNLTRVPRSEAPARHLRESLSVLGVVSVPKGGRVLDLGSGGGLPGIPLAIALPDRMFTLMDARGKKVAFLNSVIAALRLVNARAIHSRAEDAGRDPTMRRSFDLIVVRAVAPLAKLAQWVEPLLASDGICAAMKSRAAEAEIVEAERNLAKSGLAVLSVHPVEVSEQGAVRTIVLLGRSGTGQASRHREERQTR